MENRKGENVMWLVNALITGLSIYNMLKTYSGGGGSSILDLPELKYNKSNSDVWTFMSHFKKGFAKPNRFRVEFTLPKGVSTSGTIMTNRESMSNKIQSMENYYNKKGSINIKCHTMTFPQRTMQTFEVRLNSAPFKIPYTAIYEPITFSFFMDSLMDARQYFEIWQASVSNFSNNTLNFYDEYVSDVKLFVLNSAGEDVYSITLYEAYPMAISIMEMAYNSNDQILSTQITMSYKYWLPTNNTNLKNASR